MFMINLAANMLRHFILVPVLFVLMLSVSLGIIYGVAYIIGTYGLVTGVFILAVIATTISALSVTIDDM